MILEINPNWKFFTSSFDGVACIVDGLNIWAYKWQDKYERISVLDPLYGYQIFVYAYEITDGKKIVRFAAQEVSNCCWVIFLEK